MIIFGLVYLPFCNSVGLSKTLVTIVYGKNFCKATLVVSLECEVLAYLAITTQILSKGFP